MATRRSRHRRAPACEALEARDQPGGLEIAAAAWGLYNSPLVATARAVALGYKVAQLAWTGHTSLLFGTVRISQPFPLDAVRGLHPHGHAIPLPHFRWGRPS